MRFLTSSLRYHQSTTLPNFRLPSFTHFQLQPSILHHLQHKEFHTPTFIQYALMASLKKYKRSIHHITSPTGSGKTLSYLLPIFDDLKKEEKLEEAVLTKSMRPRAVVITLNKELVLQNRTVGKEISHHCKMKVAALNVGMSMIEERRLLGEGVDILFSTYNRFQQALTRGQLHLSNIRWLVVDEFDTLHETGKTNLIEKNLIQPVIKSAGHSGLEIILSGTTCPPSLKDYVQSHFKESRVIVDKRTHLNLENIKHEFVQCFTLSKHQTLLNLLTQHQSKIMVFCSTVKSLHELEYYLQEKAIRPMWTLHSQLSKNLRLEHYQSFRDCSSGVLLSTDLGARGLDFPGLQKIINYDFPASNCDYLQRAGRTGRAGQKGIVITIYAKKDLPMINELKDASFDRPIKISNSAYGLKNREQTARKSKYLK